MKNKASDHVMKLKESSHLLADVLYREGIDVYKRSQEELDTMQSSISEIKMKVDAVLKKHFHISLQELDNLSPIELEKIRTSFLSYYHDTVEQGETLKKWIPLSQLVGYTEVLVASAYKKLNLEIDKDLRKTITHDSKDNLPLAYVRMKILNAMKRVNQGKKWEDIYEEINIYLQDAGAKGSFEELCIGWKKTFEEINHPLQTLYVEHTSTMNFNDVIYDLQYQEKKRSELVNQLIGEERKDWKPADLEHDIYAQSAEGNRSLIELICNALDAHMEGKKEVNVTIEKNGYSVTDHGSGMNPYVILEKLMIPKVSGKTGKDTIGRFGVGFYTVLSHLKKKDDIIHVHTHDGKIGHKIEFKIHERTGDIFVHLERDDNLEKGTSIQVQTDTFDDRDAHKLCTHLLGHNAHGEIKINGAVLNTHVGFETLSGQQTSISYARQITTSTQVSLLVNGVTIEQLPIQGSNLHQELVLDFPITCSLPESRSELAIDQVAISALKEMIDTILTSDKTDEIKVSLCNTLYPAIQKIQARTKSSKQGDNLENYLQESFKKHIDVQNKIFLPNVTAFQVLHREGTLLLNSNIYKMDLETHPDISRCRDFSSDTGYELYIVDLKEDQETIILEDQQRLFINKTIYEKLKDTPAVLNVYFSNLDPTSRSAKEKRKGRIEVGKDDSVKLPKSPVHNPETLHKDLSAYNHFFDTLIRRGDEKMKHLDWTKEKFLEFVASPESQRAAMIKEDLIARREHEFSRLSTLIGEPLDVLVDNNWIKNERLVQIYDTESLKQHVYTVDLHERIVKKFYDHMASTELDFTSEEMCRNSQRISIPGYNNLYLYVYVSPIIEIYPTIKFFEQNSHQKLLVKNYEMEFRRLDDVCFYNNCDYLQYITRYIPFEDLDFLLDLDQTYISLYYEMISYYLIFFRYEDIHDYQNEVIHRFHSLFKNVLVNKSIQELIAMDNDLVARYLRRSGTKRHAFLNSVPHELRGYVLYLAEGGEIINTKDFAQTTVEKSSYNTELPLSTLVQAKRGHTTVFEDFRGTPEEIVRFAQDSERGIDASKAMRDIQHAAENQIVNDNYLWIREVLQNSLDAVQEKKADFVESPQISIDTYLAQKIKMLSTETLWELLQKEIEFVYPGYFHYFRKRIQSQFGSITQESFPAVLDYLSQLLDNEGEPIIHQTRIAEIEVAFRKASVEEQSSLVIEARDPVGMDLHTILNYLLIPNESSKKDDSDTIGKFGQGFFTVFADAKEVFMKTSTGNGTIEYVKIQPVKDVQGTIIDFSVAFSEEHNNPSNIAPFKGTIIQKIVDTDMPQIEAAFCKNAVITHGNLLDRNMIHVDYRDTPINASRTILSEVEIPHLGMMRIYDATGNSLTQNGLYIRTVDEELLSMIPKHIRSFFEKKGIVIDIPSSIHLIKSRTDIANKKEILPHLKKVIPALAIRAYLAYALREQVHFENIPYDYFEEKCRRYIPTNIEADAQTITKNGILKSYDEYLNDPDALTQLLMALPCIPFEGQHISFSALADILDADPTRVDISLLPTAVQSIANRIMYHKNLKKLEIVAAQKEYQSNDPKILNDSYLPVDADFQKKASVYYAYDTLVKAVLSLINADKVGIQYYLETSSSLACVKNNNRNVISYNLNYLEKELPQLMTIMEQKLPATDSKVLSFLEKLLMILTHERQHTIEGSDENNWTHNDTFFSGQRKILEVMMKKSWEIQKVLDHIYAHFVPAFVPAKAFVEYKKSH